MVVQSVTIVRERVMREADRVERARFILPATNFAGDRQRRGVQLQRFMMISDDSLKVANVVQHSGFASAITGLATQRKCSLVAAERLVVLAKILICDPQIVEDSKLDEARLSGAGEG